MKVLFVASGNKTGELGTVVHNQAKALQLDVELYEFLIKKKGILGYLSHTLYLRKYIKNYNFDIVHSHFSLSAFVSTLSLMQKINCKKVPHVVSLMGSDSKSNKAFRLLIKFLSSYFWGKTIVKSEIMAFELRLKDAVVIPNGVDLLNFSSSNLSIKKSKNINILFVGDPTRESKNFTLAEQAIALLSTPNITLKQIHNVTHENVIKEIKSCNVLLLTSKWEGSPNIIKEAMALNCPIVSTNVGDIEWLFGGIDGCYLTSFEAQDVADKINLALDFICKNGITNGRQRIIDLKLDSRSISNKIIDIYKDLIDEK